jgi:uncharacterized membrane protein
VRWTIILVVIFVGSLSAHQAEEHEKEKEEVVKSEVNPPQASVPYKVPPFGKAITEHLHNKIVHFPIAFVFAGVLFLLLGLRWPQLESAGRILLVLAALSAVLTYFTGKAQIGFFEGKPKEIIVRVHEKLCIASALSIWVLTLLSFIKPLRKIVWLLGLGVLGLVLYTAFYGGLVAHG